MVSKEEMINFLQYKLDKFIAEEKQFGFEERGVQRLFDEMIAQKEMVEALICEPVNLGKNGKVTIGF